MGEPFSPDMDVIERSAELIAASRKTIAMTGAGISVESGIPHFRGRGGIWDRYDPDEFGLIDSFRRNPGKVWGMLREFLELSTSAEPNPAHTALARMEEEGLLDTIVTQNVDGLHQRAGSIGVIEFHGTLGRLRCDECHERVSPDDIEWRVEGTVECLECRGDMRPDWVFFGEPIQPGVMRRTRAAVTGAEALLVIGTSGVVSPASDIILWARNAGAKVIEMNMEETHISRGLATRTILGPAGTTVPLLLERVLVNRQN